MTESDLTDIEVSEHAVEKYIERCNINNKIVSRKLFIVEIEIKSLLLEARLEVIDKRQRVHRLIKNRFQPAEYYTVNGWRFVVSNNVVVTIERCDPSENNRGIQ